MASRQWYTAIGGQQAGPYPDERLSEMIAAGVVRADTLVWCAGMANWTTAGEIPGLMPRSQRPPPIQPQPPRSPAPPSAAPSRQQARGAASRQDSGETFSSVGEAFSGRTPADAQPLRTTVTVWPLLGRTLLVALAQITIIPTPWVMPAFYKWFAEHIELPGQQRVGFTGQPLDIWYIFVLYALVAVYGGSVFEYVFLYLPLPLFFWDISSILWPLIRLGVIILLLLLILKWILFNLVWEGQTSRLTFTGNYWAVLGWSIVTAISVITIVGWAWVQAAWMRWMCRHFEGGNRQLVFTAGGWDILWRTWVFALSCIVIIPIPWTLHWITHWYISQFALTNERAAA